MDTIEYCSYSEYLERALNGKGHEGFRRLSRSADNDTWAGASWDEAASLASEGWAEGRDLVGQIARDLEGRMDIMRPEVWYDVEGDCVDVGAFVAGVPECVMRWENAPHSARVARILFDLSASAAVTCDAMRWKGACVVALIDKLEAEGVRVELDLVDGSQNRDGDAYAVVVRLKEASDPLHLDLIAFHLAHPASERRICFSFEESASLKIIQRHGFYSPANYGNPLDRETLTDVMGGTTGEYDLIVPALHLSTVKQAVEAVQSMFDTVCKEKLAYNE